VNDLGLQSVAQYGEISVYKWIFITNERLFLLDLEESDCTPHVLNSLSQKLRNFLLPVGVRFLAQFYNILNCQGNVLMMQKSKKNQSIWHFDVDLSWSRSMTDIDHEIFLKCCQFVLVECSFYFCKEIVFEVFDFSSFELRKFFQNSFL